MSAVSRRRVKRILRGVINTTEILLLLGAVITFAFVASLGISKLVMSQAASSKATFQIVKVNGWKLSTSTGYYVPLNFYVMNLGDQTLYITRAGIMWYDASGNKQEFPVTFNQPVAIQPGESRVISAVPYVNLLSMPNTVYAYLEVTDSNGRVLNIIGKPVALQTTPP